MLLTGCNKEYVRPECSHQAETIACIAHLDNDIAEVIPYLNAVLGGSQFIREPPCVSFTMDGRLITVYADKICVAPLRDEEEGDRVIEWFRQEINKAWETRAEITPRFEKAPRPVLLEILKLLPGTNCRGCAQPTCMVFAAQLAAGKENPDHCTALSKEQKAKLAAYLEGF